jgi:hypothetical protein
MRGSGGVYHQCNAVDHGKARWGRIVNFSSLAAFLSLFALDVFTDETGTWEELLALVIHLVPVYLVLIALVIAWKWEWVGAVVFIGLAIIFMW